MLVVRVALDLLVVDDVRAPVVEEAVVDVDAGGVVVSERGLGVGLGGLGEARGLFGGVVDLGPGAHLLLVTGRVG